jgi:RsiW-degrading membrane proteinase PrsW (M82 family)
METKKIFIYICDISQFKAKFTLVLLIEIVLIFSVVFLLIIYYYQLRIEKKVIVIGFFLKINTNSFMLQFAGSTVFLTRSITQKKLLSQKDMTSKNLPKCESVKNLKANCQELNTKNRIPT